MDGCHRSTIACFLLDQCRARSWTHTFAAYSAQRTCIARPMLLSNKSSTDVGVLPLQEYAITNSTMCQNEGVGEEAEYARPCSREPSNCGLLNVTLAPVLGPLKDQSYSISIFDLAAKARLWKETNGANRIGNGVPMRDRAAWHGTL